MTANETQQPSRKIKRKQAWAAYSFIAAGLAMMYLYAATFMGDSVASALFGAEHAHTALTLANWIIGAILCVTFASTLWLGISSLYDKVSITEERYNNILESDSE